MVKPFCFYIKLLYNTQSQLQPKYAIKFDLIFKKKKMQISLLEAFC